MGFSCSLIIPINNFFWPSTRLGIRPYKASLDSSLISPSQSSSALNLLNKPPPIINRPQFINQEKNIKDSTTMVLDNGFTAASEQQPLFSFGVIADVQYADVPDGLSVLGVQRYYRHSMLVLQRAVQSWNSRENLSFAINFGDIVDVHCPKDHSRDTVNKVVSEFEEFTGPIYHMIGNHCLYNLPRTDLLPLLKIPGHKNGCAYYDFSPITSYRFVVLDGYDISTIGWPEDHPKAIAAFNLINAKNPNLNKNSSEGLAGVERRFVTYNGGLGKEQLEWLNGVLKEATNLKQKVIICCHVALDPIASSFESLLWNYDEVIDIINRYKCVKACLAGHDHRGGYRVDSNGIHHRVFEAALECPPGRDAFGYIDVYEDRLSLIGSGLLKSTDMVFDS